MGSLFSKPKQPKPAPLTTYRDEIAGVEQVPVRQEDGSVIYITREIAKSAEEQKIEADLKAMVQQSLDEIKRLSSKDYVLDKKTQELVDDVKEERLQYLNESFDNRQESEEEYLAKRGLSDSTAGNTVRRQRNQDQYEANKNLDRETTLLEEDLRNQKLNNQYSLYNLAQNQKSYDAAQVQNSINQGMDMINSINSANYASINDYYNRRHEAALANQSFINNLANSANTAYNSFLKGNQGNNSGN